MSSVECERRNIGAGSVASRLLGACHSQVHDSTYRYPHERMSASVSAMCSLLTTATAHASARVPFSPGSPRCDREP
jgi:hypothetical protein